jgi:hypothetical protein
MWLVAGAQVLGAMCLPACAAGWEPSPFTSPGTGPQGHRALAGVATVRHPLPSHPLPQGAGGLALAAPRGVNPCGE